MPDNQGKNQGEGDKSADRRYRDGARQFIDEGQVEQAAQEAAQAVDGPEGDSLRAAEEAGKARAKEFDRTAGDGLPSFWNDEHQSRWDRIKDALGKDWLQTKADIGLAGGADLGQTAKRTLKQVAGEQLEGESTADDMGWDVARQAIRLGYGAATYWSEEQSWNDYIEYQVQREWLSMGTGVEWLKVRPLVQHGWEQGRTDIRPTMGAPDA